ncbi:unnamed protein product [Lupinus luteus]|uniref:ALOG domain-containing protein n=1 Tax=Lupinus luteus TaxID=3873 RepID=A0AAV1XRM9_LUPLU
MSTAAAISGYHNSSNSNHREQLPLTPQGVQVCVPPTLSRYEKLLHGPCPCPLKQAWGSLDALIGRLRAAFEENGGSPEINPFGARAVRLYLREVRDGQAKARGIVYEKKKRRKQSHLQEQNGSIMMMENDAPIHDVVSSREVHSLGYGNGGFVHFSNSGGTNPMLAAASYFSS